MARNLRHFEYTKCHEYHYYLTNGVQLLQNWSNIEEDGIISYYPNATVGAIFDTNHPESGWTNYFASPALYHAIDDVFLNGMKEIESFFVSSCNYYQAGDLFVD